MSIANYEQFKLDNAAQITALAAQIGKLSEDAHWELVDEMKGALGASGANESTDAPADQESSIAAAEAWVSDNCSDGGIAEEVAMALWLRGLVEGEALLRDGMVRPVERAA